MGHCCQEFIDAYNEMLVTLGCEARVASPDGPWHRGSMVVLGSDGHALGIIPNTIEPIELIAVIAMIEKSFARGVAAGGASATIWSEVRSPAMRGRRAPGAEPGTSAM